MARNAEQGSLGADKVVQLKTPRKGSRVIPLIEGGPVRTTVNVTELVDFLRQTADDQKRGKVPHRGRERSGSSATNDTRPYRNVSRRGQWKT